MSVTRFLSGLGRQCVMPRHPALLETDLPAEGLLRTMLLPATVISHLRAFYPLPTYGTLTSFVRPLGLRSWAITWAITIRIYKGFHTHSPVTNGLAGDAIPRPLM